MSVTRMEQFTIECYESGRDKMVRRVVTFTLKGELTIVKIHAHDAEGYMEMWESIEKSMPESNKGLWLKNLQDFVVYGRHPKGSWFEFAELKETFSKEDLERIEKIKLALDRKSIIEGL